MLFLAQSFSEKIFRLHFALDLKWRLKCIIIFTFCTRIKNTVISNTINFFKRIKFNH